LTDFIKFSFRSGLFSERLHGRSDLEEHDTGLSLGLNWFIEHESGATVRPGFEFVDHILSNNKDVALFSFSFNRFLGNSFLVVAGERYIRLVQNGAYVLEEALAVQSISQNTITIPDHGFVNGDWLKSDGETYYVVNRSDSSFELRYVNDDSVVDPAGLTSLARVLTLPTPYLAEDLKELSTDQYLNELIFTSRKYPQHKLKLTDTWSFEQISFVPVLTAPQNVSAAANSGGGAGAIYTVTAVDFNGVESFAESYFKLTNAVNITATQGHVTLSWDAVPEAEFYRIYRSIFSPVDNDITEADELGYIGKSFRPGFVDVNIVADFTQSPPKYIDPFAPGRVLSLKVTNAGTNYSAATISITDPTGEDFNAQAVIDSSGSFVFANILNQGKNYSDPTVIISGDGTGATAEAVLSSVEGTFPQTSARFRQRRFYAGADANAIGFDASRPGLYENFGLGTIATPTDAVSSEFDVDQANPTLHMMQMPTGLFVFNSGQIGQLVGENFSIDSIEYDPITFNGSTILEPLRLDREVIYVEDGHNEVRVLSPSNLPTFYTNNTISTFSPDLFFAENPIQSWTYQHNPYRLIWAQRKDGSFISCTYDSAQNMRAWMEHYTQGCMVHVQASIENSVNRVYAAIERKGKVYLERMFSNPVVSDEAHYVLDSALTTKLTYPELFLTVQLSDEQATLTTETTYFNSSMIGNDVRFAGARYRITSVESDVSATAVREISSNYFKLTRLAEHTFASGEWTLDERVSRVSGLNHLEGQAVHAIGNGNAVVPQVVTDGAIEFPFAASLWIVGLNYIAELSPLTISAVDSIIVHQRKSVKKLHTRVLDTKDLYFGYKGDRQFYQVPRRTVEREGVPVKNTSGTLETIIATNYTVDTDVIYRKDGPYGATILTSVYDVSLGDDE
jgi:hypothetical protein